MHMIYLHNYVNIRIYLNITHKIKNSFKKLKNSKTYLECQLVSHKIRVVICGPNFAVPLHFFSSFYFLPSRYQSRTGLDQSPHSPCSKTAQAEAEAGANLPLAPLIVVGQVNMANTKLAPLHQQVSNLVPAIDDGRAPIGPSCPDNARGGYTSFPTQGWRYRL